MRATKRLLVLAAFGLSGASHVAAQEHIAPLPVDMELVLAVDVSASMDREEFLVQRSGYVEALRHPDIVRAIQAGGLHRIALTYIEWSSPSWQKVVVPWRVIDDATSAAEFAAALERQPLDIGRGTSISEAIAFGVGQLRSNRYNSNRRVIDISGDGPNNYGHPVVPARDEALKRGIVINGLPILIKPSPLVPDVVAYYSHCVIGGPGSFVLPVNQIKEFVEAIRRKLILEIAGRWKATIIPIQGAPPADCLAGEKARKRFADQFYPGLDD